MRKLPYRKRQRRQGAQMYFATNVLPYWLIVAIAAAMAWRNS